MIRRALLLISILAAGCQRETDPAKAAAVTDAFFANVSAGRLDAAFAESSFFFQHEQSPQEFAATVHGLGLIGCKVAEASAPEQAKGQAKQTVRVLRNGRPDLRFAVTLTHDRGAWRVFSLRVPGPATSGSSWNYFTLIGKTAGPWGAQDRPLPDEKSALVMSKETMLKFHDAIQQKSFENFYEDIARVWQRQLPLGMLTRTFQEFIDQRTNLIGIKDLEATLREPPRIDSDGLLVLTGSYPTHPHRIDFELKYYYELPAWRPFGVSVVLMQ